MKAHKFVYVTGPHGTLIRACEQCSCSAALTDIHEGARWVPIKEHDGKHVPATTDCQGTPTTVEVKKSDNKQETMCFCTECKTNKQKQHFPGDDDCYCWKCRGKKQHSA